MKKDPDPSAHDAHILEPGNAPTPFTADELRAGCPAGRSIRVRVEASGEAPFLRTNRFLSNDDDGALWEQSLHAIDGDPLGEPVVKRVTWSGLQAHASFPADRTTIESERIETAIGELDCLRYTIREDGADEVFWFAKDRPGMPVQFQSRTGDQVVAAFSVVDDTTS